MVDKSGIVYIEQGTPKEMIIRKLSFLSFDNTLFRFLSNIILKEISPGKYRPQFNDNLIVNFGIFKRKERVKITFYEGITRREIIKKIFENSLTARGEFYQAERKIINSPKYRERYKVYGNVKDLEGYLFPDTYYFYTNEPAFNMITKMLNRYTNVLRELNLYSFSPQEIYKKTIVASLIQKEAGLGEEGIISSVINNRLKKRMKLQIDATILYALKHDGIITTNITLKNKYYDSPYNTYVCRGLPVSPICNPGKIALQGAFFPLKTDYLYYVSKNNGTHFFSKTYKEHQKKVKKFQGSNAR
ncbi:endolytic transglycosylase MltG [bacterium]|nr:endolytic transglycosylase MltG [bacterium]